MCIPIGMHLECGYACLEPTPPSRCTLPRKASERSAAKAGGQWFVCVLCRFTCPSEASRQRTSPRQRSKTPSLRLRSEPLGAPYTAFLAQSTAVRAGGRSLELTSAAVRTSWQPRARQPDRFEQRPTRDHDRAKIRIHNHRGSIGRLFPRRLTHPIPVGPARAQAWNAVRGDIAWHLGIVPSRA